MCITLSVYVCLCVCAANVPSTAVCSLTLDAESSEFFQYAVSNHYWYQLYMDDLPIWGMVGEVRTLLCTCVGGGSACVSHLYHARLCTVNL